MLIVVASVYPDHKTYYYTLGMTRKLLDTHRSFMPVGIISLLPSTSWLVNRVYIYTVYTPPTPPPFSALPMVVTEL